MVMLCDSKDMVHINSTKACNPTKKDDFERQCGVMCNDVTLQYHRCALTRHTLYQYALLLLLDPSISIHMVSQGNREVLGISLNLTVSSAVMWQFLKAGRKAQL